MRVCTRIWKHGCAIYKSSRLIKTFLFNSDVNSVNDLPVLLDEILVFGFGGSLGVVVVEPGEYLGDVLLKIL